MLLEGVDTSPRAAARWNPPLRGEEIASNSAAQ
jgi:hypothetical protein